MTFLKSQILEKHSRPAVADVHGLKLKQAKSHLVDDYNILTSGYG